MDLAIGRQVGYTSGNIGKSLLWTSLDYLLLFYFTEVVGLHIAVAGWIILGSLLWDAALNPFIGYWIDRRASEGRDYRPFLRWAPLACGAGFVAIFWLPSEELDVNAIYLAVALFVFRTAYALLDVPHNALLAQLPVSPAIRMRLAGMRFFFSSLGGLIVATVVAPQFVTAESPHIQKSLLGMSAVAAVMLCVTIWQSLAPARQAIAERGVPTHQLSPTIYMRAIVHNRVALRYFALAALFATTAPLFPKLLPYYLKYVSGDATSLPGLLAAMTIGQLLALPLWTVLHSQLHVRTIGIFSFGGMAVMLVAQSISLMHHGLLPMLATALLGLFFAGAVQVIWGMSGEVADGIADQGNIRIDGGVLSFLTLVQKAALGLGAVAAGNVLEVSGFLPHIEQGEAALQMIWVLTLVVPAFGALLAAILYARLSQTLNQK